MLHQFCEVKYRNEQSVVQALGLTKNCLCTDRDLPVRVEAAMALQGLLSEQTSGKLSPQSPVWDLQLVT